jgi:hypothetical protein
MCNAGTAHATSYRTFRPLCTIEIAGLAYYDDSVNPAQVVYGVHVTVNGNTAVEAGALRSRLDLARRATRTGDAHEEITEAVV